MMQLRPEQSDLVEKLKQKIREGKRAILIQLATGGGKTVVGAHILAGASAKGNRTMFIVNRRELIDQTVRTFNDMEIKCGIIAAGHKPDYDKLVQVASVDTIRARLDNIYYYPAIIIWDECRSIASRSWAHIREHFGVALHIGLDATPIRLDRKPLRPYFEDIICGITIKELIKIGSLVPPRVYAPAEKIDFSSVKITGGDYDAADLARVMGTSKITGDIVSHYQRLGNWGQGIIFCPTIEYSENIAAAFQANGIIAQHLDGNTSKKIRNKIVNKYRDKEIKILTNVALFTAGFDVPNVSYIGDASPTLSLANYLQRAGRAARPAVGKEFYTLADHAGNSFIHGMPDADREWSLDAPPKRSRSEEAVPPIKQCEECYACTAMPAKNCCVCGAEFPKEESKNLQVEESELILQQTLPKLTQEELKAAVEQAQSVGELYDLARRQGYKPGWAYHQATLRGLFQRPRLNGL